MSATFSIYLSVHPNKDYFHLEQQKEKITFLKATMCSDIIFYNNSNMLSYIQYCAKILTTPDSYFARKKTLNRCSDLLKHVLM